ncbi:MAG TPA: glucosamine-6-phosphate deaminase [Puia sp.]|jgi:glucosamine-6-phosphate deaminase
MTESEAGKLKVRIYENRNLLGTDAAEMAATRINELLETKDMVNIIFAAAASQNEFLDAISRKQVNWERVNAFHMDEYIGLSEDAPQQFGKWLKERIFGKLPFHRIYYLNGQATDLPAECARYGELLEQHPPDLTFMGIGENAHLAFNDPHVADFRDPRLVKVVDLDEACKQQQVNEQCFGTISQVPAYALTLSIPALLKAAYIYCMVPGASKSEAVYCTLNAGITERCPSTILRTHPNAWLFLDWESASRILEEKKDQPPAITKNV